MVIPTPRWVARFDERHASMIFDSKIKSEAGTRLLRRWCTAGTITLAGSLVVSFLPRLNAEPVSADPALPAM